MQHLNLQDLVNSMKTVGDQLVNYNFPKADPKLEDDLNILKTREVLVDGYELIVHFNKAEYPSYYLETLQILTNNAPFLPFSLVVKIAKHFLGKDNLALIEVIKDQKKIYCWTIATNKRGIPIEMPVERESDPVQFEGFQYSYLDSSNVTFM